MKENAKTLLSNKKEVCEVIERRNAVRTLIASAVFVFAIPCLLLFSRFSGFLGNYFNSFKIWAIIFEISFLALTCAGYYVLSHNEVGWFKDYSRVSLTVQLVFLSLLCGYGYRYNQSIMYQVLLIAYFAMVPILGGMERKVYLGFTFVSVFVTVFAVSHSSTAIMEVVIAIMVDYAVCSIVHDTVSRNEHLNICLKLKTITSEKDPLTGLLNRRGLENRATTLWPYCNRTGISLAAIEIDIDFFKKYNDKFGHPAGDECLRLIASALGNTARRYTDVIARTGGEEFIVIVQDMSEEALIDFCMNIRKAVAELQIPHAVASISKYVTVSMGISVANPSYGDSFEKLYENADKALYQAKANGRNCVVYNNMIYGRMKKSVGTVI